MFFLLPFCFFFYNFVLYCRFVMLRKNLELRGEKKKKNKIEKKATKEKERQESLFPRRWRSPNLSGSLSLSLDQSIFFLQFSRYFLFSSLFLANFTQKKTKRFVLFIPLRIEGFIRCFSTLYFVIGLSQYKFGNVSFLRFLVLLQMFSIQKESISLVLL